MRLIPDAPLPAGRPEIAIDSNDWAPGVYLAVLPLDGRPATHTLLVRR